MKTITVNTSPVETNMAWLRNTVEHKILSGRGLNARDSIAALTPLLKGLINESIVISDADQKVAIQCIEDLMTRLSISRWNVKKGLNIAIECAFKHAESIQAAAINEGLPMETPVQCELPFSHSENVESDYTLEDQRFDVTGIDRSTGRTETYKNARFTWSVDGKRPLLTVAGHCISHCLSSIKKIAATAVLATVATTATAGDFFKADSVTNPRTGVPFATALLDSNGFLTISDRDEKCNEMQRYEVTLSLNGDYYPFLKTCTKSGTEYLSFETKYTSKTPHKEFYEHDWVSIAGDGINADVPAIGFQAAYKRVYSM